MFTASGFNRITALRQKLLSPERQARPIVFRGLSRPTGGFNDVLDLCNATSSANGGFTFPIGSLPFVPFGYTSTSMALDWSLQWAGSGLLLAIDQQRPRFA